MKRLFWLILSAGSIYGNINSGLSFLQLGVGARGPGLGGIGTGITSPEALYYNPAGLGRLNQSFVLLNHSKWLNNIRYEYVSYGQSIGYGFISFGVKGLYTTDLEKRINDTSEPLGYFGAYGLSATVGYAYPVLKRLAIGASLSGITQALDRYSGFTLGVGLGLNYKSPISGLDIGMALINLGPKLKLNTQQVNLPSQMRLGIAYLPSEPFPSVFFDITKGIGYGFGISSGLEYKINIAALRVGYGSNGGITLGFGMEWARVSFDYCFHPFPGIGLTHQLSLIYSLGSKVQANPEDRLMATMHLTSESFYNDGLVAMSNGSYDAAKKEFDKALIWDPNNSKALSKYEESVKKSNEKAVVEHYQRGQRFFSNKNYLEAVFELEYVITLDSTNTNAKLLLAQAQNQLGRPVKAENYFDDGLNYYAQGRYKEAITAWDKVISENPDRTDIASYIESAKAKIRQKVDSLADEALTLQQQAKYKQALNKLNKALVVDPGNQLILARMGEIRNSMLKEIGTHLYKAIEYFGNRDYQKAETEFQLVLSFDSNNRDAKEYLKRLKTIKTQTSDDLYRKNIMAITAYGSDDLETAIRLWEEILSEDPNFPDVKKNLSRARAKLAEIKG